jgi:uncharacterized protein (DUF885 family)
MRFSRRGLLASAAAVAAFPLAARAQSAGAPPVLTPPAPDTPLNRLLDEIADAILTEYPENASFRGVDTGPRQALKHRLTDRSDKAAADRAAACRDRLARLKTLDRSKLTGLDAVNYDCTVVTHQQALDGSKFGYGDNFVLHALWCENISPYAATQMTGDFQSVPDFLDSMHAIETSQDADAYVDRLDVFGAALDQESERLVADQARGVAAPDFILDNLLGQLHRFLAQPTAGWGLVTSVTRRAKEKGLSEEYAAKALAIADKAVRPAIERQAETLKAIRLKATPDAGVWKLPDGEAYYAWLLQVGAGDFSADELHKIGVEQNAALEDQMDGLLRAHGLTHGTTGARMAELGKSRKFLYPNTDKGREDLIDYLNGRIAAMRPKLKDAFHTRPDAKAIVRRVPPDIEAGAPNGYEEDGPLDGSRPATYYINLMDTANWPRFALPTLTFHETIPGHVWQGAYSSGLPLIRSLLEFNAYAEGWALYAEQLGDELGLYADDPFGRLGYLQSMQFRACRLVVDTGVHAKRWTRDHAIAYLRDHTGRPEAAMRSEIDRYCAVPGQACGYKVGHTEINRLRAKAKTALGPKFDLAAFNDEMVTSGSVPLSVLGRMVDGFVTRGGV